MLEWKLSKDQFRFLSNCHILDAIGVAQECVHSIKKRKLKAIVLKIDLIKAYDRADWSFLRLVLLQIVLHVEVMKWIMACISTANFAIMIDGRATDGFKSSIGLRQGCPLSPLLFFLVIKGLSLMINYAKSKKSIQGIRFSHSLSISHILFVDDMLIFGRGSMEEWSCYHSIISLFCYASGMMVSAEKMYFSLKC